jgi:hypothetical protein
VRLHLRKEVETEPLDRPAWHLLLARSYLRITPLHSIDVRSFEVNHYVPIHPGDEGIDYLFAFPLQELGKEQ